MCQPGLWAGRVDHWWLLSCLTYIPIDQLFTKGYSIFHLPSILLRSKTRKLVKWLLGVLCKRHKTGQWIIIFECWWYINCYFLDLNMIIFLHNLPYLEAFRSKASPLGNLMLTESKLNQTIMMANHSVLPQPNWPVYGLMYHAVLTMLSLFTLCASFYER